MMGIGQERPFWQWFAEEGFNQIAPLLRIPLEVQRPTIEEGIAIDVLKEVLGVENMVRVPSYRPNEDEFFRRSRLMLSEHANISFEYRPIQPAKGMLLAWKGHRMFVLGEKNSLEEETAALLHMLGHIALGHFDEQELNIHFEGINIPKQDPTKQQTADIWAQEFKQHRRLP